MLVGTLQGVRVWLAKPKGKQDKKDGRPTSSKYLGKVHLPVFTPNGQRIVGFMVKQPDIAGMIKQPDRFVALDAFAVDDDGSLLVADVRESFDAAAAKRLGVDLDACIIWTGMDVQTKSGTKLGYCADASFNYRTGAVDMFKLTPSGASSALIGYLEMPASYLVGYAKGTMVVKDEASQLEFSGGAAAKAAEASVKASEGVKKGAKVLDEKGSEAVEKGSHALGRQIGKTAGAFKEFSSEYKKAAGTPAKKASASSAASAKTGAKAGAASGRPAKKASSGSGARAVGRQLGRAGGMFSAFASEFKKAAGTDAGSKSSSKTGAKKKPSTGK